MSLRHLTKQDAAVCLIYLSTLCWSLDIARLGINL
jgi:hypothetical protein